MLTFQQKSWAKIIEKMNFKEKFQFSKVHDRFKKKINLLIINKGHNDQKIYQKIINENVVFKMK